MWWFQMDGVYCSPLGVNTEIPQIAIWTHSNFDLEGVNDLRVNRVPLSKKVQWAWFRWLTKPMNHESKMGGLIYSFAPDNEFFSAD